MSDPILLRDVIEIPESVHQGDLVFRLADALDDADATAETYVVTPQLLESFKKAAQLVGDSVRQGESRAAYLHGSFGSGKSNFMAMLQILLAGNRNARSIPELAPVVQQIDEWNDPEKKILTVPFHMVGAETLEEAVFKQYVAFMEQRHPEASPPALVRDELVFNQADKTREQIADDARFFQVLSSAGDDGWGDLSVAWDTESFEAARNAPINSADRKRLLQDLLSTWFTEIGDVSGYVSFRDGLAEISRHAKSNGYVAVILFLDELILWFMNRMGDEDWVRREASKLTILAEGAQNERAVPIVSIIARQRDLREVVKEGAFGGGRLGFDDVLRHMEGRFDTISLDDSNLPLVANRRLLSPKDASARAVIDEAFAALSLPELVKQVLLGAMGTDADFRLTYPFSPAFMTVLVDVSGALQRTRTGLRVLLDLLVANRDTLTVGQLVPVGDLYDVLANTDYPFSPRMEAAFNQARNIYDVRLRRLLLEEHGLTEQDPPTPAFQTDDRLVKTLLLAALASNSEPFRDLTVAKLVALNHGLINAPVPGMESNIAATKLRKWAASAGELRVGDDLNNPTVNISLDEVDIDAILDSALAADTAANRRMLVRDLLLEEFGLAPGALTFSYQYTWRGIRREVEIVFGNVRDPAELPDAVFAGANDQWKVVIDFPFDDGAHAAQDDLARLDGLRQDGSSRSTIAWLPSYFTKQTTKALSTLVRLNHVLANDDRFRDATQGLNELVRKQAQLKLQAQQKSARDQVLRAVLGAYAVITADEWAVENTHSLADHFVSLRTGFTVQPPTDPTVKGAFEQVLDQAFSAMFPAAPTFDVSQGVEVRLVDVKRVYEIFGDAVGAPDGRHLVGDTNDRRTLARIANPLQIGVMGEQAFTVQKPAGHWDQRFSGALNRARQDGVTNLTVGLLRDEIESQPTGLTRGLQNLIILSWALATNHRFVEHGGPATATIERLEDGWEVVEQPLPEEGAWLEAVSRLGSIFGVKLPVEHRSAYTLEQAGIALAEMYGKYSVAISDLTAELARWSSELGMAGETDRQRTAVAARSLLDALHAATTDLERVESLVNEVVAPSEIGLGRCIASAQEIAQKLQTAQLKIIVSATGRGDAGRAIGTRVVEALSHDEIVVGLVAELAAIEEESIALVTGAGGPPPPPTPPVVPGREVRVFTSVDDALALLQELRAELAANDATIRIEWQPKGDGAP